MQNQLSGRLQVDGLAEKLEKDQITVSRWCRNVQQPSLPTLFRIAELLEVKPEALLGEGSA